MKIRLLLCIMSLAVLTATGCVFPKAYNLPPAQQLLEPGPGVGGPGPGVIPANAAANMGVPGPAMIPVSMPTVQLLFARPEGMQVRWDVSGHRMFDSSPLVVPGRQNFPQDGIYRLKITNIAGREGVELYPTVEIAPTTPRSEAFLAHNAIPVQFTEEDFDQVLAGNFVTKVIYLPDPEFQELALAGVETLVSTRLDPGVDPIAEADRRGAILAVIRVGNKDIEMPGSIEGPEFGAMGGMDYPAPLYCGPGGRPAFPPSLPPNYVAGVTAPQYGMTMSGTPIGLPGPPHIPLGGPAGLQTHTIKNHTHYHIPGPTEHFKVHVRQQPGFNYPKPVNRVHIREQNIHAAYQYGQPHYDKHERIPGGGPGSGGYYNDASTPYGGAYCPPGQ
jgi:hypothetical protein